METKNKVDAVQMVRQIRDAHYDQLKDKSVEDRLEFYRRRSRELRAEMSAPVQQRAS